MKKFEKLKKLKNFSEGNEEPHFSLSGGRWCNALPINALAMLPHCATLDAMPKTNLSHCLSMCCVASSA